MKEGCGKFVTHELYHSLTLCNKGFTDWNSMLSAIMIKHKVYYSWPETRCAEAMAEELIAYYCSGMCTTLANCTHAKGVPGEFRGHGVGDTEFRGHNTKLLTKWEGFGRFWGWQD